MSKSILHDFDFRFGGELLFSRVHITVGVLLSGRTPQWAYSLCFGVRKSHIAVVSLSVFAAEHYAELIRTSIASIVGGRQLICQFEGNIVLFQTIGDCEDLITVNPR